MKVRKAVIPAAGYGTRFLPATKSQPKEMLPIIDKPTIQWIVEEAVAAGIEEINLSKDGTLNAIESISAVAEETSAASEEVDATAVQQLEAVTNLNESAKHLQRNAKDLEASIKMFKTK